MLAKVSPQTTAKWSYHLPILAVSRSKVAGALEVAILTIGTDMPANTVEITARAQIVAAHLSCLDTQCQLLALGDRRAMFVLAESICTTSWILRQQN